MTSAKCAWLWTNNYSFLKNATKELSNKDQIFSCDETFKCYNWFTFGTGWSYFFFNYGYKMLISAIALLIMHKVSIKFNMFPKLKYEVSVSFTPFLLILHLSHFSIKEVRCNCSAYRSAHFFVIAISSHSHKKPKQPQWAFLQYSCSVTMIISLGNICGGKSRTKHLNWNSWQFLATSAE